MESDDIVRGAKAIGEVINETPRRVYSLVARGLIPARKRNGGGCEASRAELVNYVLGIWTPPTKLERKVRALMIAKRRVAEEEDWNIPMSPKEMIAPRWHGPLRAMPTSAGETIGATYIPD